MNDGTEEICRYIAAKTGASVSAHDDLESRQQFSLKVEWVTKITDGPAVEHVSIIRRASDIDPLIAFIERQKQGDARHYRTNAA